tara:strand:- start:3656 stop:4228 length:573 start_codon:yes stop_codon:yes gene_type:complete
MISPARLKTWIEQAVVIGAALSTVTSIVVTVLFMAFGDEIKSQVQTFLGIDELATKADVAEVRDGLEQVKGEDRIIYMPVGHSYVEEPVNFGEVIKAHLVMRRTARGESCVFIEGQSLFSDYRRIPFPGSKVSPIKQIGEDTEELYIELRHPEVLSPGRIKLTISMKYECNGVTEFDETRAIFFYLTEGN